MIHLVDRLRKIFPNNSFARHVLTLITGTTIAQVITVGSSPILTRIYTPDDFGHYALLFSIASILSIIASGSYELAIMLPEQDEDSINVVALSVVIPFCTSLFLLLIILLCKNQIAQIFGYTRISNWLYLIPIQVIFTSIYQSFNYWSNRKKQYKRLALSRVLKSTTTVLLSIFLGLLTGLGFAGLMIGYICGQIVGTGLLAFQILQEEKQLIDLISIIKIKNQALKYIDFPKHLTISYLMGTIHQQIPIFLTSRLFGADSLGFFSMAEKLIYLPGSLIADAIGEVFRREATEHYNRDGRFDSILKATVNKTFLMALPIYSILFLFSPSIFSFVFGKQWQQAGEYAAIMAAMGFFSFVINPIDKAALIVGATKYTFLWNVSMLIANISLGIFFSLENRPVTLFLWSVSIVKTIHYFIELYMGLKFSRNKFSVI